jgi:hypothetical protein
MQDVNADGGQPRAGESIEAEKRIAHSGALARWAGHCARHPKRVVFTWLGVFVAADRAERRLPRQADQRLQDPRLGHAEGDRPDHREVRRAEGSSAARRGRRSRRQTARRGGRQGGAPEDARRGQRFAALARPEEEDVRRHLEPACQGVGSTLDRTAASRTSTSSTTRRASSCRAAGIVALETQLRSIAAPAGLQVEFTGEAENARRPRAAATSSA